MARHTHALLVEDNPVDARLMRAFIESQPGWTVQHTPSLAAAREAVEADGGANISLVVVDLSLPDAHGLEAVEFARQRLPEAVCVVVTGERLLSTAMDALRHGASDYLVKDGLQRHTVLRALQLATLRRDILRQAEDNERNLTAILSAMPDALLVVDDDGQILLRNTPAEHLLVRFTPKGPKSHTLLQVAEGELIQTNVPTTTRGQSIPVEVRVTRLRWGETYARLVLVKDKSSERATHEFQARAKKAEELAKVGDTALGDWHDIANKLMSMRQALERLTSPPDTSNDPLVLLWSIHGHLQKLAANYRAQTVATLSNVRVEVDLAALVKSTCDAFRFQLDSDIDLIVRLNPIATVLGSDVQLGNALDNLLVNARHAITGSGRRGTIRVTTSQDGDTVQVQVADDGPGFPTNLPVGAWLERGTSGRVGGSGLGLHSVRETAERHGGTVHVSSVEGRGATVTLKLPRAQTRPTQGPRRVLLIDDDVSVLRAATRALRQIHTLQTCMDGQAALDLLQRDSAFDAILCDLEMPRLDGPGLYRALQVHHPQMIPRLAFCSGGASTQEMRDFLREVNPPMLPKPFEAQAVIALVEALASGPTPT